MNKYKDLEPKILDWADDRDLLGQEHLLQQSNRIKRDVELLHDAVLFKSKGLKEFYNSANKISKTDEAIGTMLGKMLFDMIILAEIHGISLEDCLTETYKNK